VIRHRYHPEASAWYRDRSLDAARRLADAVNAGLRSIGNGRSRGRNGTAGLRVDAYSTGSPTRCSSS